jgi:hypothetical protein
MSIGAATILGGCAQRVPHLSAEESLKPPTNVIIDDVTPHNVDLSYPEHQVKLLGHQD